MTFIREHKIGICIFALALAARLLYFGLSVAASDGDLVAVLNRGDGYFDIAQNIISGHGYSIAQEPPYTPTSYRTPLMPYVIAAAYTLLGSWFAVALLHLVLGSLIPLLGMRIAGYLTQSWGVRIFVGLFLALEPTSILFSGVLLSEIVFTFVFSLMLLCLFRYWKTQALSSLLMAAFLLGLSTLTRPTVEYLPFIIVPLLLWEARSRFSRAVALRAGAFVLIFLVTISPWLYRNYQTFGVVGLSSQQGTQLYAIAVPSVLAIANNTSFEQEYNSQIAGPNDANFAQSAQYTKLAVPILLSHPQALALMSVETAFSFFTYDGTYDVLRHIKFDGDLFAVLQRVKLQQGIEPSTPTLLAFFSKPAMLLPFFVALGSTPVLFVLLGRAIWLVLTVLFFAGAGRRLYRQKDVYVLAAVSIVLYFMLTSIFVGFTINYRYRMPVTTFIITLAACEAAVLAPRLWRIVARRPMV